MSPQTGSSFGGALSTSVGKTVSSSDSKLINKWWLLDQVQQPLPDKKKLVDYVVGVYDKRTNEVTLHPTHVLHLSQAVKVSPTNLLISPGG
jgi:hypothetical protein